MEPSAASLDTTPDPAIVQPPGASPLVPPREQHQQEQLRIGDSGQFSEGLEDRGEHLPSCTLPSVALPPLRPETPNTRQLFLQPSPQNPGASLS